MPSGVDVLQTQLSRQTEAGEIPLTFRLVMTGKVSVSLDRRGAADYRGLRVVMPTDACHPSFL